MWDDYGKVLRNVAYAGVGVAALAVEKAGEVGKVLVEKGEIAVEQGKQFNEELQQKLQDAAQKRQEERFNETVSSMTAQEREELRRRLAELDELEREAEACAQGEVPPDAPGADNVTPLHPEDEPKD